VRRLYNPKGTKLPLPRVVELNRRLIQGYNKYKDDPRIVNLKKEVLSYNAQILALGVRDHQVQYARVSGVTCFFLFCYRVLKLCVLSIFVVPGTLLFGLVFAACKFYSGVKAKQALAESNVKVQARDVLATWKLMVAMAVAPLIYTYYVVLVTWLYSYNRLFGILPDGLRKRYLIVAQVMIYPTVTYAALRFGEVAMDIARSLGPLLKMINPWTGNELAKAQARREKLAERITDIINTLGPEMFDDFYSKRIISDPFSQSPPATPPRQLSKEDAKREASEPVQSYDFPASPTSPSDRNGLRKNESFTDLANQDIFCTRPSTPKRHHSRRPSGGFGQGFQLKPFSTIDGNLDEVSKRIKSGMRSRGHRRSSVEDWHQEEGSGATTPRSEASHDGLTMSRKEK
jgi:glycerol-3-phosphate O-acyltransferase/dihydroxyacetone phosphate acyltransferase